MNAAAIDPNRPGEGTIEGILRDIASWDHDHCALIYAFQVKMLIDPRVGPGLGAAFEKVGDYQSRGSWAAEAIDRVWAHALARVDEVLPDWPTYQARIAANPLAAIIPEPPVVIATTASGAALVATAGDALTGHEVSMLTDGWNRMFGKTRVEPPRKRSRGILARLGFSG